ncbi:PH domain-containing protein [Natrialba swarupiae]|uniref:PH domain-containing protein n=1 Tax=Natrialba swarupiae TaxID=2448032 RepID=A0A5D5AV11_9EURY|nr:PH domain-containing protein [Natrialba swarupiae]TYT63460.1 PH domain-containing protein [Natrialba swarupiae]
MTDSSPNPAGNADGPNTTSIDDLEWLSLEAGEEIVWADGPDKRTLLPSFLVGIPLAIVLVGILIIVSEYLRVTNTAYVVTNRALYRKTGVLSRDVKRIEHEKVQDISYSQSALGTQFGYGTVEVSTAGGSGVEMSFKSVPEPRSVQQLISELIEREHREEASDRTKTDVLTEIRDELRAIRTTLEESDAAGSNAGLEGVESAKAVDRDSFEWSNGDDSASDDDSANHGDSPSRDGATSRDDSTGRDEPQSSPR